MVSSPHRPRGRAYHHGDLKAALIESAIGLVEAEGAHALRLRALARRVGVSQNAPYNHFPDRAALVAAVAAEGYRRLGAAIAARMSAFPGRPARQLQEAGVGYVVFAVAHPGLFRLMFGPEVADRAAHPELQSEARRMYEQLSGAIGRSTDGTAGAATEIMPLVAWSLVHGLAVLVLDQQVGGGMSRERAEALAFAVTDLLWRGIRRPRPRGGRS